jgi:glycyl-tRNA synthetase beta chain
MTSLDRELLLEIGCEELPASWLPGLTAELGTTLESRLKEARLTIDAPVETFSTPRRLTAAIGRLGDRQADADDVVSGPPVSAAFTPGGEPTPATLGFARKQGVSVAELDRLHTPKGEYLVYRRSIRGKATVDVLPAVLGQVLRDLTFPKHMHWDAMLEDGRGDLVFGRPIRWLVFLYGGRVVPFAIRRTELAQGSQVQDVVTEAITYGHRFLAGSGRAGRAIRIRSFAEYRAKLGEHFVMLDREERHERIARELDVAAARLGGRVASAAGGSTFLDEVADLVEYPNVVAGTFPASFLTLPEEVLTTTMIHHQHYFPVVDHHQKLMAAFLAVTNIEVDDPRQIAVNAERVLVARLRDATFFWEADRRHPIESRLDRLATVVFHRKAGTYRDKAERIERLAAWVAGEGLGQPQLAPAAAQAARLAKVDLTTDMVREFTELQGTMGGIYAREEGLPVEVWKAIYYHYLPIGVEATAPPTREQLGPAAVTWAAVSLADKVDSVVALFAAGERPTGTRDPLGVRRQLQGALKILVDLPEVTGTSSAITVAALVREAAAGLGAAAEDFEGELMTFVVDRLRHLFASRGFRPDEIEAALGARGDLAPLTVRRRLEALQAMRGSDDFTALAGLFKRVRNLAREISPEPAESYPQAFDPSKLTEAAELALLARWEELGPRLEAAVASGDFRKAMAEAAALRPAVDRFFSEVFVMADDLTVRTARLMLLVTLRDRVLAIADISQLASAASA